jgi:hypothetical protein
MKDTKQQQAHGAANERLRRRLLAAGVPVPAASEESIEPEPELTVQIIRPEQAKAYDFRRHIEFVLPARIRNRSYAWLEVQRLKLRVVWDLPNPVWPRVDVHETRFYLLPGGHKFPHKAVLNHRIGERIGPGEFWQGLLLAVSLDRMIPGELLHGVEFPARIVIIDQFGRRHTSAIELRVDRTATMRRPITNRRIGSGLYGPCSGSEDSPRYDQPSASAFLQSADPCAAGQEAPQAESVRPGLGAG